MAATFEVAGKGALLTVAVSLITSGSKLVETDLYAGIALLVAGIALVIAWSILIDKEAKTEAMKAAKQEVEKLKLELERKKYG